MEYCGGGSVEGLYKGMQETAGIAMENDGQLFVNLFQKKKYPSLSENVSADWHFSTRFIKCIET